MKLVFAFLLLGLPAFPASCLIIDSITLWPAPCATGTCFIPGIASGSAAWQMHKMVTPTFIVQGHNLCKLKAPLKGGFTVEFAYYDANGARLGIDSHDVSGLEPGEKFKHAFDVPEEAAASGPVVAIKVRSITEADYIQ